MPKERGDLDQGIVKPNTTSSLILEKSIHLPSSFILHLFYFVCECVGEYVSASPWVQTLAVHLSV